jgi:hypothetical protein
LALQHLHPLTLRIVNYWNKSTFRPLYIHSQADVPTLTWGTSGAPLRVESFSTFDHRPIDEESTSNRFPDREILTQNTSDCILVNVQNATNPFVKDMNHWLIMHELRQHVRLCEDDQVWAHLRGRARLPRNVHPILDGPEPNEAYFINKTDLVRDFAIGKVF